LLHPSEEVFLLARIETALKQQILETQQRGDKVADLVREPRGKTTDRSEPLRTNETILRLAQFLSASLELFDLTFHPLLVGAQLRRHLRQARGQTDHLGGPGLGNI